MTRPVYVLKLSLVCVSVLIVSHIFLASRFKAAPIKDSPEMTNRKNPTTTREDLKKVIPEVITTSTQTATTTKELKNVSITATVSSTQKGTTTKDVSPTTSVTTSTQTASITSESAKSTTIRTENMVTTKENQSSNRTGQKIIPEKFFDFLVDSLRDTPYPGVDNFTQYNMLITGRKPLIGHKALRPEFGEVINDVTFFKYPIEIKPCAKNNDNDSVLVIINSAPGNFDKRQLSRETWIPQLKVQPGERRSKTPINLVGFGFMVGLTENQTIQKNIEEESKKYGDILQIGMMDAYYNLTTKVAGLMNWMNNHCSHVDFVFKLDDDVYANVNNLAIALKRMNESDHVLYGTNTYHPTERGGKWYISYLDWPWKMFPPYPTGQAVLFTGKSIPPLLAASQTIPFLPFDDTYFWGLCTEKAGVKVIGAGRVYALGMAEHPTACDVFTSISWDSRHAIAAVSHEATKNFYTNATQCIITNVTTAVNTTINPLTDEYVDLLS